MRALKIRDQCYDTSLTTHYTVAKMLTRHKRVYPAQSTRPFPRVAVGEGSGYARLSKHLKLSMEMEEERRGRLENDAATKRLRLAMETDEERKARLKKRQLQHSSGWPLRQRKKEEQNWSFKKQFFCNGLA